jgi:hypothetical protein
MMNSSSSSASFRDPLQDAWLNNEEDLTLLYEHSKSSQGDEMLTLVLQNYPLRYFELTNLSTIVDGKPNTDNHIAIKEEQHLPKKPSEGIIEASFKVYKDKDYSSSGPDAWADKDTFATKFDEITEYVDKLIEEHQGVLCFKDGQLSEGPIENRIYLHIADVISIWLHKIVLKQCPMVCMKSPFLLKVGDNFQDMLSVTMEDISIAKFIMRNADYFYMKYAYWDNHSNIPIRLNIPEALGMMSLSHQLLLDPFFQKCQLAKFQHLCRKMITSKDRITYGLFI